jgi:tripartite-type tricarboxylate transporter receptor subunit TctC
MICIASGTCYSQSYPSKPIRIVAPFPPGGATDVIARAVGQKLTNAVGQTVVVDNRPGAGGNIGAEQVAKASADGYTLLMGSTAHAINMSLYEKMPYHLLRDFVPITQVATVPNVLVINPAVPAKTVRELVSLARGNPGKLNLASSGNGSVGHLSGALLQSLGGIKITHVPYKGTAQVVTDLVAGQVDIAVESLLATLPQIRAGKLRVLGVTSASRSALLPEVQTIEEAGLKGFLSEGWSGLLAPAGTPDDIVRKLNVEIVKSLSSAEMRDRLFSQGAEPVGSAPQQFAAFLKEDVVRWAKLVRLSAAKVE